MKKLWNALKSYQWGYFAFAVLLIGSGIAFLVFPETALQLVVRVVGILAALLSILRGVTVLADRARGFLFFFKFLTAILGLAAAVFMIVAPSTALEYLAMIAGLYLIIDGSFKLQTSIMSKRYTVFSWWFLLALAVACILGGFFLIKYPPAAAKGLAVLMGILLIVDGAQNLASTYYLPSVDKRMQAEYAEKATAAEPAAEAETNDESANNSDVPESNRD